MGNNTFSSCCRLSSFTLGASTVCTLSNSYVFTYTPFAGYKTYFSGTPVIYVPASLLTSYKTATNWTYFSQYMQAIPEVISFKIGSTTYQALEGMTWEEWINSEYNVDNYYVNGNKIEKNSASQISRVVKTDVIIKNNAYSDEDHAGGTLE